jgi:hypothetical protein
MHLGAKTPLPFSSFIFKLLRRGMYNWQLENEEINLILRNILTI